MSRWISLSTIALLMGCVGSSFDEPTQSETLYDYQLYESNRPISVSSLAERLSDTNVIMVGEWHTHSGIHLFQANLLRALENQAYPMALAMEQFATDKQSVIDRYLAGEIGEHTLTKQADAWPNYESDYRPLVEYAKANQITVIAANAPERLARCVNLKGIAYLDTLNTNERQWLATSIDTTSSPYKDKFFTAMHHGTPTQLENLFAAQMSRDETMAESITKQLALNPNRKVMFIAGKFHTEDGLGVAESVLRRNPQLKIAIIEPVIEIMADQQNALKGRSNITQFQLKVIPLPKMYVEGESFSADVHFSKPVEDGSECP